MSCIVRGGFIKSIYKRLMLVILSASLLLCGCAAGAGDCLAYSERGFAAAIEGTAGEFSFSAALKVGMPKASEDGSAPLRDVSMKFMSPQGMEGITISRQSGEISLVSGDYTLDGELASGWLAIACLLIPEGEAGSVKIMGDDEDKLGSVEIFTSSGIVVIYVDLTTGYPVRAISDNNGTIIDVRVVSFSVTSD